MMLIRVSLTAAALFALISASPNVRVALYEESLCPYCNEFLANAFDVTYNTSCVLDVMVSSWEVIPWGNAKMAGDGTVTCQHGPNECKGNKLQACAQAHFNVTSQWMELFRCQGQAYPNSVTDMQACAEQVGMDWDTIQACYDGAEGDALIDANYKRTAALNPPHAGVPWVVVNDVPVDDRDQLLTAICEAYVGTKPACCPAAPAFSASRQHHTSIAA